MAPSRGAAQSDSAESLPSPPNSAFTNGINSSVTLDPLVGYRLDNIARADSRDGRDGQKVDDEARKHEISPDRSTGRSASTPIDPSLAGGGKSRPALTQGRKYLLLAVFCLGVFIDGEQLPISRSRLSAIRTACGGDELVLIL